MTTTPPNDCSTFAQTFKDMMTGLGILATGIWSYLTFVRGRTFAANVEIEFAAKQIVLLLDKKAVLIHVKIKNIGRTRVQKQRCHIVIDSLNNDKKFLQQAGEFSRIDSMLDFPVAKQAYDIFQTCIYLEPSETEVEDVLIGLGEMPIFKVGIRFVGYESRFWRFLTGNKSQGWASSAILDVSTLPTYEVGITKIKQGEAE